MTLTSTINNVAVGDKITGLNKTIPHLFLPILMLYCHFSFCRLYGSVLFFRVHFIWLQSNNINAQKGCLKSNSAGR
jgi:hypothetical protein